MQQITIGCDPELFAFDQETGDPVSVHDILKGNKHKPFKVPRGAYQVDGVAAEFNIAPAATRPVFLQNIKHVSSIMRNAVAAQNKNLILKAVPSVIFSEEYFGKLPEETKALGCDPDFNAYTEAVNEKPNAASLMRTGSGHIHVGWTGVDWEFDPDHIQNCLKTVKALDAVLEKQSFAWDKDTSRRALYGKPGDFRPKKYGVEYRTLSNAWLNETWSQMFVFDAALAATKKTLEGCDIPKLVEDAKDFTEYLNILDKNQIPTVRNYNAAA